MAQLTETGLETRTQAEILAEMNADQAANVSEGLDTSTSSPNGQINRLMARAQAILEEALGALYAAIDPDSATGDALLRVAALRGTIQRPAQPTRVACSLDLDAGTYSAGDLVVAPTGRPGDTLRTIVDVVTAGGATPAVVVADVPGPLSVAAGTLGIASPLSGFNAVLGNDEGVTGKPIETEGELRKRSNDEIESPGSASVGGIAADITREIEGVVNCYATENDTDATVDSIPPHSVEVVVFGPDPATDLDNDTVAAQILASKAAGIGTYGNVTRTAYDPQGFPHAISFTRPSDVPITIAITVAVDSGTFSSAAEVQNEIVRDALIDLTPGRDCGWSNVSGWALKVPGVWRVTAITVNGVSFGNATITSRQRATVAAEDVTVTVVEAAP